uniref:Uncharacterized protein n=1 Tax=viral metagenome TaxID=1070528 RepID=A0A6M3K310_9ZZZZ
MPAQIGYFDTLKSVAGKVFTYLASITLTGTDGKTITCTQDTSLDEAVAMSSKAPKASPTFTTKITTPIIDLTGGQIAFPAAQAASANANTLDDYEEGTWTPVYMGTEGSIGATAYQSRDGRYTKIGDSVLLSGALALSNNGDWSGVVLIGGIPFANSAALAMGAVWGYNITYDGFLQSRIGASESFVSFALMKTATTATYLPCTGVPDNSIFRFSIQYFI